MRTRSLVFAAFAALTSAGTAQAAWYNNAWFYRTQLTINGALVPAGQTNFPVLVAWSADANLAAAAQASGNDILFTAADGTTKLDHEIESYTSATGALAAWVRIPTLNSPANTTIYVYYGNAGAANQQNRNPVWTTGNFVGVWHLEASPANGVAGHADSTGNGLTGTPQGFADGTPGSTNAAGIVSGADNFLTDAYDGTNLVNRVEVAENPALRPNGSFTVEAWVNLLSPAYDQHLVYKLSGGSYAYQLMVGVGAVAAFQRHDSLGGQPSANGTTTLLANTWYHMVGVYDGASVRVYLNGSQEGTTAAAANNLYVGTPQQFNIGATYWGGGGLNGREDEVRFSSVARSADWIRTEYNNVTNQGIGAGRFILSSTPETFPVTTVYYSVGTSAANLGSGGTLTIAAGVVTFSVAQPNNVGVGDRVSYGAGPTYAYISGRTSPTQYTVTDRLGAVPPDVPAATAVNSITRAFNSLTTAESGSGDGTHLGNFNLVTGNFQLNWACYNDGPMNDGNVVLNGYTTDAIRHLRIFAPVSSAQVGTPQRHRGTAGTGFRLRPIIAAAPSQYSGLRISNPTNHVRIEGIEIDGTQVVQAVGAQFLRGIWVDNTILATADIRIDKVIVHHLSTRASAIENDVYGICLDGGGSKVSNSAIYAVRNSANNASSDTWGIEISSAATNTLFNNTVYDIRNLVGPGSSTAGIAAFGAGPLTVRNTAALLVTTVGGTQQCFAGAPTAASHNVSSDATATGTGSQTNKTAYATYFLSTLAGSEDLHLRATSLTLWGSSGMDLSAHASLPLTDDIDGMPRLRPDIGADEFGTAGPHMLVKSGRYTGTGVAGKAIDVDWQPDAVLVKRIAPLASDLWAVLRTTTMTGTKDLDNAGLAIAANLVTSLTATGFTVGTDARVNANGGDYAWVAFKAAGGELKVDKYVGLGGATQAIAGVGFQPDYLIVMPEMGTNLGVPAWTASTFAADVSFTFDAEVAGPNCIRALLPDGFEVGNASGANSCGELTSTAGTATFHYVAWNATPGRMTVGTYTGDAAATRNIDDAGFFPEWVIVKRAPGGTDRPATHKPASTGTAGAAADYGLRFVDNGTLANTIEGLRPLGFQIGNDERVNSATACGGVCTYHWVAFGPHAPAANLRSIGTRADYGTTQTDGNGSSVTATQGSQTVTGSGTVFWRTFNRGRGDVIEIDPGAVPYTIASVDSETQLTLTTPYAGVSTGGKAYRIRRQFATMALWEDCVDGPGGTACPYFPVTSASLVTDDRSEVGIAYEDSTFSGALTIDGSTTDANHTITLTADGTNRHYGLPGQGVVLNRGAAAGYAIQVYDDFVTLEWLEITNTGAAPNDVVFVNNLTAGTGSLVVLRNNLVHDAAGCAFALQDADGRVDVYNDIVYTSRCGVAVNPGSLAAGSRFRILNNTFYNLQFEGATKTGGVSAAATILLRNNIAVGGQSFFDFDCDVADSVDPASSHNISEDATTGASHSPAGGGFSSTIPAVQFVNAGAGNFHVLGTSTAANVGANLSGTLLTDIDETMRQTPWDIGADDVSGTTAVGLMSFEARASDGSVDLQWRTGSEVDNLGFHVYRSLMADGPWARLTSSLIPGQGFSPMGASYAWRDSGLVNGTRYFYRLEDVDTRAMSTFHGPVSAVPQAGEPAEPGGSDDGSGSGSGDGSSSSCPSWALAQLGSSTPYTCETHGEPASSFRVLSRTSRSALVELQTAGFVTARDATGRVRALLPGFDSLADPLAPALPLKRARIDGIVGRHARIGSIQGRENRIFPGLRAAAVGYSQAIVLPDGTVQAGRREAEPLLTRGVFPRVQAHLAGEGFQGEDKTLALELLPLRYDASRGALVLSRKLTVRIDFAGVEPSETGRGRLGRHVPRPRPNSSAYAFLGTSQKGLHSVAFESVFPGRSRAVDLATLKLTRRAGASVPFFVVPQGPTFGPGGRLFFHVEATASSTSFSAETVCALERGSAGVRMSLGNATADGSAGVSSRAFASFETNRVFAPDVLDIEDLWQWESIGSGVSKTKPFALDGLDASSAETARLVVYLQGGSDAVSVVDHHVQLFVGGALVADESFDGALPHRLEADVPVSLLAAANELTVTNVGDTGVSSRVFLDRFEVVYPQVSAARSGVFDGVYSSAGTAAVEGFAPVALLDVTSGASWLTGFESGPTLRFRAEAGHRYLAVSQEALLAPRVFFPEPSARLRSTQNQADYVLVAPRAFLGAAQPLLERREAQGLTTFAASLEEIASSFGGGQPTAEAIREFLSFAYHQWRRPSPRYVLLLGDANHDPRRFNPASQPSPMPFLLQRTSYIWTASDPALAAVNGEDAMPDLAIGRLPATTLEQAETMIGKILDWEAQGQNLDGKATLVADNPDFAGDFEADARDIEASFLSGRETTEIFLGQVGNRDAARTQILDAFNSGLSLISYVGHGGGAVWASENMLNSSDPASLLAQPRQPFMLTMNCLNGYFITPFYESLAEGFLKAQGKGTIGAFSPSGLSLDGPAHLYHRAVMQEITGGQHERLGDAILVAQKTYADSGAFPELLGVYHLFGDPALRIR